MNKKIEYNGKVYSSVKAFATEMEMPYQTTASLIRKGYTPESVAQMLSEKLKREKAAEEDVKAEGTEQPQEKGKPSSGEETDRDVQSAKAPSPGEKERKKTSPAKAGERAQATVSYRGREYPSLHAFCVQNKLNEKEVERLLRLGASLEEIVSLDLGDTRMKDGIYQIAQMSQGVRATFTLNPYCVLGISAGSGRKEALDVRDKLEKLSRIGAESAYKSAFDLAGVERPYRKLENIQAMLRGLENPSFRYLWFLKSDQAKNWQSADPVVTVITMAGDEDLYDQLLAQYYHTLIADPDFFDRDLWKSLLVKMSTFFYVEDSIQVKALGERALPGKNETEIAMDARKALMVPVMELLDSADGQKLLRFYDLLADLGDEIAGLDLEELRQYADRAAATWVRQSLQGLSDTAEELQETTDAWDVDESEVRKFAMLAERCAGLYFHIAEELSKHMESVAGESMMRSVKSVFHGVAVFLYNTGRHKREAGRYFSMIYAYCTKTERQEIRRVCDDSVLNIPDSALAVYELVERGAEAEAKRKVQEAYRWYREAALRGDEQSQLKVARLLLSGKVKPKKGEDVATWWERAALNGNEEMCREVSKIYHKGTQGRRRNQEKAKEFAVRAFLVNPSQENKDRLDQEFPGWETENNPLFRFEAGQVEEERLEKYAKAGILPALCAYGQGLIAKADEAKKELPGKKEDYQNDRKKKAAYEDAEATERKGRRLLLQAVASGDAKAESYLKKRYRVDTRPAKGPVMLERAELCEENPDEGLQDDLQFYWYSMAAKAGEKKAYYGLASCYDNGIGTDENPEMGYAYYQKALDAGDERARLSMAGSLMIGRGVERDLEKAKAFLIEASASMNPAIAEMARSLMEDRFGRRKGGALFYDDFQELLLCDRKGIQVSFLGIQTEDNKFRVKLQIRNGGSQKQTVWIKNLALDGKTVLPAQMLGQFATSRSGTAEVTVSRSLQNPVFRLEFSLEVRRSKKDVTALGKAGVSVDANALPPAVKAL